MEPGIRIRTATCTPTWEGLSVVKITQERKPSGRWKLTTPQWPIMHAVLHGVTRDQMMARHKANHINVAYAPTPEEADKALAVKAAMFSGMGIQVHLCGKVNVG